MSSAMTKKTIAPSVDLLRSLSRYPSLTARQCPWARLEISTRQNLHTSVRRREEELPRSFRMQLFEATAARVKRQRDEEREQGNQQPVGILLRMFSITFTVVFSSCLAYFIGSRKPPYVPEASTLRLHDTVAPKHNLRPQNLRPCWTELVALLDPERVVDEESSRKSHSGSDWSSYVTPDGEKPAFVVYPETTEEVSGIMKICHKRKIPVTGYSGGTSLEGHFSATRGGVCIDFTRMDKILDLHKDDLDVVVQPGVGWENLNEELGKQGLFFPPDPGPGAMIGGMVGTGCSGTNAYRYGTMRDWVINLTVVLADGTVIKTRQRPRKSSAGYDLTRTFIGSEGTLGLVTEATLKLTVKPKSESVAVTTFPTIRQAADCVSHVVQEGVQVAAVEIMDDVQMRCINEAGATSREWQEAPTLLFKFAGTPAAIKEQVGIVQKMARKAGSKTFEFARDADERAELWSARKEALWSVMAQRRDETDHVWTTDVAVPISRLPDIIEETKEDMKKSGLNTVAVLGHVGDGNFHTILLFNDKERKTAEEVVHRMVKRAVEMEGTVTGEHGVGLIKRDYLPHELDDDTVDAMRKLKQAFDPLCLLNCDKVVRSERLKKGEELPPW